ncbi:uncharacterized protein Z519_07302 [Cladophialophora bantiana CBS 173.52]|uniref:Linalool dehydratase/isomerase domain-containing protein n=1 Tax=Cladophialophora bantiana (strain ATCC 10958 / CBS 173.52 / CDC B-1940 / NIH 8579) TaxID=1442370 RepID=A0A0D2HGB1_CLAB1|nr:uncharacterized protein Z519_07302 [Cladophialophora bantiana CBS 173.52]KIW92318.1 hypothetical protein Z519_07302 [Cladophialophora bantiana CBS 173.52]
MAQAVPPTLSLDLSQYPKLSPTQLGHLRHFHNLAFQPDGEWAKMGAQEPLQEFLDAYRYQLATMAYAVGVAHYHRLPALRSIFKPLLRQLIHKMLRKEVWAYWFNTSLGGTRTDPGLQKLREPWADPVVRENIMYSGHLLLMTSLYAMLFDDDEFEKPESLVFKWDPIFFGLGDETFFYDNRSLQAAITREMERNGWVGVCCEPNVVFVVCNQFPIIAMKYNDSRDGTNNVEDVLAKYKAAWDKKGMVASNSLLIDFWMVKQDYIVPPTDVGWTAWAGAFMHSWNPQLVESLYPKQVPGFITNISGRVRLQPPIVANHYRKLSAAAYPPTSDWDRLQKAIDLAKTDLAENPAPNFPYTKPCFGYVVQWLSELGQTELLDGLLAYADQDLNPTWDNGGLFYPRNDTPFVFTEDREDGEGVKWTHVSPFCGNAAIGYARLNIKDGQRIMYENPWTRESLAQTPWIDNLDFVGKEHGVGVLRGVWDEDAHALVLTVKGWDFEGRACPEKVSVEPVARNLGPGKWAAYVDGKLRASKELHGPARDDFKVTCDVKRGQEVDVVFMRVDGGMNSHVNGHPR